MSRHWLFALLLATGISVGDKTSEAQAPPAAGAPNPQQKTQAAPGKTEATQGRTEREPAPTEPAQAKQEEAPGLAEPAQAETDEDAKLISVPGGKALGMSILGNQDAPKSLVIVPWKTSELGNSPGISPMLDDSKQPVDREVFMRALRYYEIRSTAKP